MNCGRAPMIETRVFTTYSAQLRERATTWRAMQRLISSRLRLVQSIVADRPCSNLVSATKPSF